MKRFACSAACWAIAALALGGEATLPEGAHPELAVIEGPAALAGWTQALADLSAGKRPRVSVCHFGDSHLQQGQVDGVLRRALQARYGDAGRGYVFPYTALDTASPIDTGSASDAQWRLRRMMGESAGGPVGPGGLAALCEQPNFVLALDTRLDEPPSVFDRVRILYAPGPDRAELWVATRPQAMAYMAKLEREVWRDRPIQPGETLEGIAEAEHCRVADLKRWNGAGLQARPGKSLRLWVAPSADLPRLEGFKVWGVLSGQDPRGWAGLPVDLGQSRQHVFLLGAQKDAAQVRTELLGTVLERNEGRGLFWHSLAANGAQAQHFDGQPHLSEQLKALAPDLIIVSLGTNETQQRGYEIGAAIAQQERFWRHLREAQPGASLLILAPPDAKWGRHASKRLDPYIVALRRAALQAGAAFLDLRAAQGGFGAYARWAEAGLAGKDGVHYRSVGYELWGRWLLEALRRLEPVHAP